MTGTLAAPRCAAKGEAMATMAAERDIAFEPDARRVDDGSATEPRALPEADRSRFERLLLRYITWDTEHPHHIIHRAQHKVVTTLFRLGYGRYDDEVVHTAAGWRIRHRRYQHGS